MNSSEHEAERKKIESESELSTIVDVGVRISMWKQEGIKSIL